MGFLLPEDGLNLSLPPNLLLGLPNSFWELFRVLVTVATKYSDLLPLQTVPSLYILIDTRPI